MSTVTDEKALEVIARNMIKMRGKLSYSEIGRRAGTTAAAISRIEKREHMPGVGLLTRIADALGCQVEDLLKNSQSRK